MQKDGTPREKGYLPPILDVVVIDDRGRIRVPVAIANSLQWIVSGDVTKALAALNSPGCVMLHPWEQFARRVSDKRQLLQKENRNEDLLAFNHIYRESQIPADLRVTLNPAVLLHLGLRVIDEPSVYVVRLNESIGIYSPDYWNDQIAAIKATGLFSDMP